MCVGYKCVLGTSVYPIQVCVGFMCVTVGYKSVLDTSVCRIQMCVGYMCVSVGDFKFSGTSVLFVNMNMNMYVDESSFAPSIDWIYGSCLRGRP